MDEGKMVVVVVVVGRGEGGGGEVGSACSL